MHNLQQPHEVKMKTKLFAALFLFSSIAPALKAAELIRVPLHIHYLKSSVPEINAPKDKVDIKKLLKEANQIWKPADIQFFIKEENILQADEKATKAYAKGELPMTALHPEERFEAALEAGVFSKEEADFMRQYEEVVLEMLTVDDFPFDEFARNRETLIDHNPA